MGYEISWLIPGSLLDRAELAHVLHGAGAQVVDRQTSTVDIEVEVRARDGQAHLGVLELHVGEPRSGSRQVVTESAIEECLFRDEPRHEASLEEEDPACWAPGSWTSIVELADHGDEVAIAGHGPALITLVPDDLERKVKFWPITSGDAWRSLEWERPCIAEVHHQGVHLWACGSPGLVFCRSVGESWRPLATGIPVLLR